MAGAEIQTDTPVTAPVSEARPPVPPEAPMAMPVQTLRRPAEASARAPRQEFRFPWRAALARIVAFGGTVAIGVIGYQQMLLAFGNQVTPLQLVLLGLFTLTFGWVGFSFCSVVAGFLAPRFLTPAGRNDARIVVVMPVYHENAGESLGLLAALGDELSGHELLHRVEFFVASDSRRPEFWLAETRAVSRLRETCPVPVWYRRRSDNEGRKAGNIADIVRRWGGRYDQVVVLDADSIVTASTLSEMSARMSADPALGLIQTMPVLVGGQTMFARLMQFAGRFYGPAVARGVSAWSGDSGNYWGHNALIRVSAFAACCGLPVLKGPKPFGGSILSHDFVEAALLRRAGWKVQLHHDLRGSFEGCPPTLLDNALRERRWAQGNLQHLGVIASRGMSWVSRMHFAIGILGFLMSPIWLAMILVGLALTANVLLSKPEYFPATYQLFPDWPVFDPIRMLWLFGAAMAFLLLPKAIAIGRAISRPTIAAAGGPARLSRSALFEILLSALIAPVQMLIQTRQIFEILSGRDSGWEAQVRAGNVPSWGQVLGRHWLHVVMGFLLLGVLWYMAPGQLIWLSPILAGLILSPLTSRWSASPIFGRWARRRGLLQTPEEQTTPHILAAATTAAYRLNQGVPLDRLIDQIRTEPEAMELHMALLPGDDPARPASERLPEISAGAKIAVAGSRVQALDFLDADEKLALFGSPRLLTEWSRLPA